MEVYPFGFMDMPIYQEMLNDAKEGDFMKLLKERYPKKDVVIFNMVDKINIDIVNPDLIKDFFTQETNNMYVKNADFVGPMRRIITSGLVFSEGDIWKKKRKLLNRLFNFDMVKGLTNKLEEICDDSLTEVDILSPKTEDGYLEFSVIDYTSIAFGNVIMESFLGGSIRD